MGESKKKNKKKRKNSNYKANIKTIATNEVIIENGTKTDYDIPTISFKSSLILMIAAAIATLFIPFVLTFVGISFNAGAIIGNITITAFALAYTRYFVDTNRGYCKGFFRTYAIFAISFAIIGYFWLYLDTYL